MKELIEQLQAAIAELNAKMQELNALRKSDATVDKKFSEEEQKQLKQVEFFVEKRKRELDKAYKERVDDAMEAKKTQVKITSPDPAHVEKKLKNEQFIKAKLQEENPTWTTAEVDAEYIRLRDEAKRLGQELPSIAVDINGPKGKIEVGVNDKTDSGDKLKHKSKLEYDREKQKVSVEHGIDFTSADGKKEVGGRGKLTVSKEHGIGGDGTFVHGHKDDDGEKHKHKVDLGYDAEKKKVSAGYGYDHTSADGKEENGGSMKLNYSEKDGLGGDGSFTHSHKNDDGSKDKHKVDVGYDAEKKKISLGYGHDHTDPSGKEVTSQKGKLSYNAKDKELEAGFGMGKVKKEIDGDNKEKEEAMSLDADMKVTKDKFGFNALGKMHTKSDGKEKQSTEVKAGFEIGHGDKAGDWAIEVGGKQKFKFDFFPPLDLEFTFATVGVARFFAFFSMSASASLTLDLKARYEEIKAKTLTKGDKTVNIDAEKAFTTTLKAEAEIALEAAVGLGVTFLEIIESKVQLVGNFNLKTVATVTGRVDEPKSFKLGATEKITGLLEGAVELVVGLAKPIRDLFKKFGGNPDALSYTYQLGKMTLFELDLPEYEQGKPYKPKKEELKPAEGTKTIDNKVSTRGKFVQGLLKALMAVAEFIDMIISAITDFLAAIGKALVELGKKIYNWFANLFSAKRRREQEEKAMKDAKYNAVVKKALNDVKKNNKLVEKLSQIPTPTARREELERIVREDEAVKAAYFAIYKPEEIKNGEEALEQLKTDITQFALEVKGDKFKAGDSITLKCTLTASQALQISKEALRVDIFCDGKRVVTQALDMPIAKGSNEKTVTLTLPADAKAEGKWEARAALDLLGNIKDMETNPESFQILPAPPQKEENTGKASELKAEFVLLGAQTFRLQFDKETLINAQFAINATSPLTPAQRANPELRVELQMNGAVLMTQPIKQTLADGINPPSRLQMKLPKQNSLMALAALAPNTTQSLLANALRKSPPTLVLFAGKDKIAELPLTVQLASAE